jgi:serine phosphatase RsbU (regulator of sigma subunit)
MILDGNRITLKAGKWEYSDFAYNALGCLVGSSLGLFKHGYRFGQTALGLSEQKPGKNNRCRINFLFGMMIVPWTQHARSSIDYFRKAYKLGLECGDFIFSAHSINLLCMYRIILGDPLDEIMNEYESYHDFQTKGKDPFVRRNYIENIQMLRCLSGQTPVRGRMDDDDFNEQENLDFYLRENNKLGQFYFLLDQLRIRYLFGDYTEALSTAEEVLKLTQTNVGLGCLHNGDILFYHSLTLTALYPQKGFFEKIRMMTRLRLNQIKMRFWAKNSPDNFRHKYLLIDAEIKRIKHQHFKAANTYREALQAASQSGYLQHEALANELYARFYLSVGHMESAGHFYTEACRCYQKFGARSKVNLIREAHPGIIHELLLIPDTSSKKTSDVLDLATVIKASQDISGEIVLGKLLTAMLNATMENAGAERGFLILEQSGRLVVEAEGNMGTHEIALLQSLPLDDHEGLSISIVNYTARTREPLILNNASTTGNFTRDPYILKHQPKSILCLPILRQGNLSAIIYFENNLTANAFMEDRLEVLKILSSQAAISIDNARLYENMEEKVRTRTIELNETLQKVEEVNQRIMDSITYASLIQQSLLPDPEMIRACLPSCFFIWQPRDIIGGDMYHMESFETGFVLTVIDCTGHGVPGAFMTMLAVSGLRRIIHEDKEYNPSLILKKLNIFVKSSLRQDKANPQSNDGLDAAVITYHKDNQSLDFASARLPLYLVKNHELQTIKGDKRSLGYVNSDTDFNYRLHTLHDLDGASFYVTTDGFTDQLGGTPNRRLGSKAFLDLITTHHDKPFDQQQGILLQALARHKGMEPYTDDITVAGFRIGE